MSETKKCPQCGQEKPIEDFSKSYKNLCKSCVAENKRVRYAEAQARGANEAMYGHRITIATAAMQGILASGEKDSEVVISQSIYLADALIKELNKPKNENNQ